MNTGSTPPIPPFGKRANYICKLDHDVPGIWILKRDSSHAKAYQDAVVAGVPIAEAMTKAGGIFYASAVDKYFKPSEELLAKAETACQILEEDAVKFWECLKSAAIEKEVWIYICSTDPWFRPRGSGVGTLMLWDNNGAGPGVWIFDGDSEAQDKASRKRMLGEDDEASMRALGGVYYATKDHLPEEYK